MSPLVSIGLPTRNGAERIERVVKSVLAQDHEPLELVICDNASTDDTEEVCRTLAKGDDRIVYHRHPQNIGLLGNFVSTMRLSTGEFFRWMSDDDALEPNCVSRSLEAFAADDRLLLVMGQISYTGDDGVTQSAPYDGTALGSDDPIERFTEMLRLLNESHLLIDPLYGLFRRAPLAAISRRNMLREDEVFAAKLALAGPWGYVPEVLGHRHWKHESISVLARRLDVPAWQAHFATTLQCREMLRWVSDPARTPELTDRQRRQARAAVRAMWLRRQQRVAARRTRKLVRLATRR
jgi:glycosyltransferase involved in cell wall biosynthesis